METNTELLIAAIGIVSAAPAIMLALAAMMRRSLLAAYADVRADLARAEEENRADRARWRNEREGYRKEILASTAERAECRERLAKLEATVAEKLLAAQPRDAHGRFEAERG